MDPYRQLQDLIDAAIAYAKDGEPELREVVEYALRDEDFRAEMRLTLDQDREEEEF